jgi:hypothetical protein
VIRKSNIWIAVAVVSSVWWHRTASTEFNQRTTAGPIVQASLIRYSPAIKLKTPRHIETAIDVARRHKADNEKRNSPLLVRNWIDRPAPSAR